VELFSNQATQPAMALTKGYIDYTPHQVTMRTILRSIVRKQVCLLEYKSAFNAIPRQYAFAPSRLVVLREAYYVLGWVVTDKGSVKPLYDESTTLLLHRIRKAKQVQRFWSNLPEPTATDSKCFGLMGEEPFEVRVAFKADNGAANYVAERIWSADQELHLSDDGSLELTFTARSRHEVVSWVLGFGANATLLEPEDLRAWIKEELAGMTRGY
jgi:predicted DNA-binding transcriptional regulator YafY